MPEKKTRISDIINAKNIAYYINNIEKDSTIDEYMFPYDKQLGLELSVLKGAENKPIALKQSAFDVSAKIRALRTEVSIEKKRMPFFKESVTLKEEDRRLLIQAINSENKMMIDMVLGKVFENYASLVDGALIQAKRMRCQLLQFGEISLISEDGDVVADYGVPSENKEILAGNKKWSDTTNANIIGDIKRWQEIISDRTGVKPTTMLLTEKTFSYIVKNKALTEHLKGINNPILADSDYVKLLKEKCGVKISIVGGKYLDEEEKKRNYYENGIVTLVPDGTLGRTVFGTTPEEFDLMSANSATQVDIVHGAIAITTKVNTDPVTTDTKVSAVVMPSFEMVDHCFFATVADR